MITYRAKESPDSKPDRKIVLLSPAGTPHLDDVLFGIMLSVIGGLALT
jgi:hypothetical protein